MENENNNLNLTSIRIKQMRLEKKWTQKDLSKKLGLKNDTAIANYEAGYSIPKDDIKLKMTEIFNCTLDYLLGKSDIRNLEESDPLGLAKIGFSMKDYNPPSESQKQQIKGLLEVIMKDNKKDVGDKKNESK